MKNKALVFENAEDEGPGILAEVLARNGWDMKRVCLYLGEEIPRDWGHYNLLIVMGGPMNVYEEETYPFLLVESGIIADALNRDLPVMGFCLGAQLMAKACGAKVKRGHKKEIGWYRVRLTDQGRKDRLLESLEKEMVVFQWHGDTFELPPRAVRLAGSEDYANQAMRIGSHSYGFQFHFEITQDMISRWVDKGTDEIQSLGINGLSRKILRNSGHYLAPIHALGKAFFDAYLKSL